MEGGNYYLSSFWTGLRMAKSVVGTVKRSISYFNKMVEGKAKWQGIDKGRREEEGKEINSANDFFHNLLVKPHSLFENLNRLIIRLSFGHGGIINTNSKGSSKTVVELDFKIFTQMNQNRKAIS